MLFIKMGSWLPTWFEVVYLWYLMNFWDVETYRRWFYLLYTYCPLPDHIFRINRHLVTSVLYGVSDTQKFGGSCWSAGPRYYIPLNAYIAVWLLATQVLWKHRWVAWKFSVASIVRPDGNMVLGFEPNFIEIFRLQVRFWY